MVEKKEKVIFSETEGEMEDDIENTGTNKELRQRYVSGAGGNENLNQKIVSQKGKKGNSKEIMTAAVIAVVAVFIVTVLLILAIHVFKLGDDS